MRPIDRIGHGKETLSARYVTPQDAVLPAATLLISSPSTYASALVRVLVARKGQGWVIALLEFMLEVARK